ncbi:DUF3592 domain-containing protein [Spartinivicinus poritis]|uniref:DUF3592 domain-containing protein n=1 Tax=Spartinivicinus poritis TaxID=2994640 RepID=A0ABT5U804_9GAMM|nr:DUF3592 domain-containing protein [Spartinivicinus sp. A2-2]MDE1462500.1 DUF3592 domain-containing protein [Spartinivicinus sp. A2-2]
MLILFIFTFVGIAFFIWGVRNFYRAKEAISWPKVPAHILTCDLIEDSHDDKKVWEVELCYQYVVNNSTFTEKRLAFGYGGSGFYEKHKAIYDKLQTSDSLLIKYDPNHPEYSTVVTGFTRSNLVILVFGFVWMFCSICGTVMYFLFKYDFSILHGIKMISH